MQQQLYKLRAIQNVHEAFILPEKPFAFGKFGQIYKAQRRCDNTIIALKKLPILRHNMAAREFNLWSKMSIFRHNNIAQFLGRWADDDHIYIGSEYLSEQGDAINERWPLGTLKRISYHESKKIIHDILKGVAHCHRHNVAHCDIKLSNICGQVNEPNEDVTWKLIDFGSSQECYLPYTGLKMRTGTPLYIAPEVWTESYGFNVDVWAIGVLAHQLFTGLHPFYNGNNVQELVRKIGRSEIIPYSWNNQIPEEMREWIARCLEHDKMKRPPIDVALKEFESITSS